ncbi:MAG TPA: NGG1p interacting factor NIF3 [Sphaerochaeta sp.]|nr:NGG1p interacting factor NIF3 [Sphaerochaeta sp.]
MYILVTYVPPSHLESVKAALFASGAGSMGSYDQCSFQTLGVGQYRPLKGSKPHSGEEGVVAEVDEWRLEMVVARSQAKAALKALFASHPYEEVAYHLIAVLRDADLKE